jgi:hypothetical protein
VFFEREKFKMSNFVKKTLIKRLDLSEEDVAKFPKAPTPKSGNILEEVVEALSLFRDCGFEREGAISAQPLILRRALEEGLVGLDLLEGLFRFYLNSNTRIPEEIM